MELHHHPERFEKLIRLLLRSFLGQPHISGAFMNFPPGSRLEILDAQTVRFIFPEPDGAALAKLSAMHLGNRQFYRDMGWGEKHW
jgi:hypothetical protein